MIGSIIAPKGDEEGGEGEAVFPYIAFAACAFELYMVIGGRDCC